MSLDILKVLTEPSSSRYMRSICESSYSSSYSSHCSLGKKNRTRNTLLKSNPAVIIGYLNHLPAIKYIS